MEQWEYGYNSEGSWEWKKREEFADKHGRKCAACGKENLVSNSRAEWVVMQLYKNIKDKERREQKIQEWRDRVYHIDHIIPRHRGGTNDESNLQLLCRSCNVKKGTRTMEEFLEYKRQVDALPALKSKVSELLGVDISLTEKVLRGAAKTDAYVFLSKIVEAVSRDE